MNKFLVVLWIVCISFFSTVGYAFDQNALDRLSAGEKNLAGADFSGATIPYALNESDGIYRYVDFTGANFANAYMVGRFFETCNFSQANFSGANLINVHFKTCTITGVNFSNIDGKRLRLQFFNVIGGVDNTNFSGSDLTDAAFTNVNIKTVRFMNADLTRTNFQLGSITSTKFDGATFNETVFYQVKIPVTMKSFLTSQSIIDNGIVWTSGGSPKSMRPRVKKIAPKMPKGVKKGLFVK